MQAREYIATILRFFRGHISGWVIAGIGIVYLILSAIITRYITDPKTPILVLNCTAAATAVVVLCFLLVVAPYEAWKEQGDQTIEAERKLASLAQSGPEVWLDFQNSPSFTGFTVENRSHNLDAIQITIDPFATKTYRVAPSILALLRHGETQALSARMVDKRHDISFIDIDLGEMLKDTSDSFNCSLQFTVRYTDPWGNRFVRSAAIDAHLIELALDKLPQFVNHAIARDFEELTNPTGQRVLIPRGETITNRPAMSVDKRSVKAS